MGKKVKDRSCSDLYIQICQKSFLFYEKKKDAFKATIFRIFQVNDNTIYNKLTWLFYTRKYIEFYYHLRDNFFFILKKIIDDVFDIFILHLRVSI